MRKTATTLSIVSIAVLAAVYGTAQINGAAALGSPLFCKNTGGCCSGSPFAYFLSLPISSPLTNETDLLAAVPHALYVSEFDTAENKYWRWDGSDCCQSTAVKGGAATGCHPVAPGGCFTISPGEGYAVVASQPGSYDIEGTDGSTVIALKGPAGVGGAGAGKQLISLPYCSTITNSFQLMQSIGGGVITPVASVARYNCATDTLVTYTGRMGAGAAFPLVAGESYLVTMNSNVNYSTSYSPTCPPAGCPPCGPDGAACDDANACTTGETCSGGVCTGGTTLNCDDGDPGTLDFCDCTGGCVHYRPPCVLPNAGGTIDLPPDGCGYVSPFDLHMMMQGMPFGTEVHIRSEHRYFFPSLRARSAFSPSTIETFDSELAMRVTGTGLLAGTNCDLKMRPLEVVVESQPTQLGQAVQDFDTDMKSLTGTLSSDTTCNLFQSLSVTAGSDHGLPSPGHVHLEQRPDGTFDVQSSFDVMVTMSFVGKPGSVLEGMSGSTTRVVRMGTKTDLAPPTAISLGPASSAALVGTSHVVTAAISGNGGHSLAGVPISFQVTAGPNAGASGTCSASAACATDAAGNVSFSYTSNGRLGTDQIQACFVGSAGTPVCSALAAQTWECSTPAAPCDDADACTANDACAAGACVGAPLTPLGEVTNQRFSSTVHQVWDVLATGGPTAAYDLVRGSLAQFPVGSGAETCLASSQATTSFDDALDPAVGNGFWYLVRGRNACSTGGYGAATSGPRSTSTCP